MLMKLLIFLCISISSIFYIFYIIAQTPYSSALRCKRYKF